MTLLNSINILSSDFRSRSLRESYWEARKQLQLLRRLCNRTNRDFAKEVVSGTWAFLRGSVDAIKDENDVREKAAVEWLLRGQAATDDDGVSLGYFPCNNSGRWSASYPETTGYIIQSLLEYAERENDSRIRERALTMAHWEISVQMPSGAVQGGPVCSPSKQRAAVFNTGMVLQGYTAAFRASGDSVFIEAGRRAADFLLNDLDESGNFRTHGDFVTQHQIKTYNVLCAWAMYRFGGDSGETKYQQAAEKNLQAVLKLQNSAGWFHHNCLDSPEKPLTHTIGYTLQGILETGLLAGREDFVVAVVKGVDPILKQISPEGFLSGRLDQHWNRRAISSCLTGSAQIAIVLYRLFEQTRHEKYCSAADRLTNYLKAIQCLDSQDEGLNGAIAGSFPIMGSYMTGSYPNWATKYFLDALMLQDRLGGG